MAVDEIELEGKMNTLLSSVVLYGGTQPDFDLLRKSGWTNPLGLSNERMGNSLVKSFKRMTFQIVRHEFSGLPGLRKWDTYTEIYLHSVSDDDTKVLLKGHGSAFTICDFIEATIWLEEELDKCQVAPYHPDLDERPF